MVKLGQTGMFAALAVGGLLLGVQKVEAAYRSYVPPPPPPPVIQTPPPSVVPPPVVVTGGPECHHPHDPPPVTPPGGTTQHAPEPATLLSGLIGAGLAGLFGSRRRKQAVTVA